MLPRDLLDHFGGVARATQLAPFGCSRAALHRATLKRQITRLRPGVFAVPDAPRDVVTAAEHGGALTCARALRMHDVWTLEDDEHVHVQLGRRGRVHHPQRCGCIGHFRTGPALIGVAEIEGALVDAFHCHGEEFFFAAFESAWNKRILSSPGRAKVRAALPASARWLVDLARGDAESGLESLVRLRLHLAGILVEAQVTIEGVGRVDFVIAGRIILEADGRENHTGDRRHHDLERDAAASALGYESLRFDYAMIIHDWPAVLAAVQASLSRI